MSQIDDFLSGKSGGENQSIDDFLAVQPAEKKEPQQGGIIDSIKNFGTRFIDNEIAGLDAAKKRNQQEAYDRANAATQQAVAAQTHSLSDAERNQAAQAYSANQTYQNSPGATAANLAAGGVDLARDSALGLVKGGAHTLVGLPVAAGGIVQDLTGTRAGAESIGLRSKDALGAVDDFGHWMDSLKSDAGQARDKQFGATRGMVDTLAEMGGNPAMIMDKVSESLVGMGVVGKTAGAAVEQAMPFLVKQAANKGLTGAAADEFIVNAATRIAQVASPIAEGAQTGLDIAGTAQEAGRTIDQYGKAALVGGVLTAGIGAASNKLGSKLGIGDIETDIALRGTRSMAAKTGAGDMAERFIKEGAKEGFAEELPQSVNEAIAENVAMGRPWDAGVGKAAATGALTGFGMGGGHAAVSRGGDSAQDQMPAATPAVPPSAQGGGAVNASEILGRVAPQENTQKPASAPASRAQAATETIATTDTEESEKALRTPVGLTSLDRVTEIDTQAAQLDAQLQGAPAAESGAALPESQRLDLTAQRAALAAERQAITREWPTAIPGNAASFSTESGSRLDGQYALIDADQLVTSHDTNLRANPAYPKELQPRERDRAASELQVSGIVQRLDPARLGLSADSATGAPIVGADGLVESGNARTIALKRIYQANGQKAADYKQFLADNAGQFGITPESVQGMKRPVLVRVRSTPVNRAEFARQANASTVAAMSPSEQAKSDSKRIDAMDDLSPDDNGDFGTSREFIRRFMARLPQTEQGGMIDADGKLSTTGYTRISNAVLAKAYGDSPVLARMVESRDDNLRNVSKALLVAAPTVAKMRQAMEKGARFDADITPDLMAAVEELSRLKDSGTSVSDALAQAGMFGDKYSPETRALLQFLSDNIRRPRKIADFITAYMDALDAAGDPNQGSLLGDVQPPVKGDLLNAARKGIEGNGAQNTPANSGENTQRRDTGEGAQAGQQDRGQPQDAPGHRSGDEGDGAAGGDARAEAVADFKAAAADLADAVIDLTGGRAMMVDPENDKIHKILVRLFTAAIKVVGTDMKAAVKWVKGQLKADPETKPIWNKIHNEAYQRAALEAVENGDQTDLASADKQTTIDLSAGPTIKAPLKGEATPERQPGEADKAFAKRVVDKRSAPSALPENYESYFNMEGATVVPMANLISTKSEEENQQGGDNGPKRMVAAAAGELSKRGPITVMPSDKQTGKYEVVDGNGTLTSVSKYGWKALPVMVVTRAEGIAMMEADKLKDRMKGNYKAPALASVVGEKVAKHVEKLVSEWKDKLPKPNVSPQDVAKATEMLVPVIEAAKRDEAMFDKAVKKVAAGFIGYGLGPTKKIERAAIKLIDENFDLSAMKDIVRATVVVNSYGQAKAVIDALGKEFKIRQINNKAPSEVAIDPMDGVKIKNVKLQEGYQDVTVFVYLPGGGTAEVQINTPEMLSAKNAGHVLYEGSRVVEKDPGRQDQYVVLRDGQQDLYRAAADASKSRANRMKVASGKDPMSDPTGNLGISSISPDSSFSLNTLPSGNSTHSEPDLSSWNLAPSGNLSGTLISSPSSSSIPKTSKNGYTESDLFGEYDGNDTDGESGTQGQESGAVQGVGSKRATQRVRDESGGRDSVGNRVVDTGAADQGQVGQAGTDGVRQQNEGGAQSQPGVGVGPDAGVPTGHDGRRGSSGGIHADARLPAGGVPGTTEARKVPEPAGRDIPPKTGLNYQFGDTDLTYEGSWAKKAEQNVVAVELVKKLESEARLATPEEQKTLAKFVGWGSSELANNLFGTKLDKAAKALEDYREAAKAMDTLQRDYLQKGGQYRGQYADNGYYQATSVLRDAGKIGPHDYPQRVTRQELDAAKPDAATQRWIELRARLQAVMSKAEMAEASRSTQYAHYTSKAVVSSMWKAMDRMGFKGGHILEPGAGIGVFAGLMPQGIANNSSYTGIEFDSITGGILKQLFPDERILVESYMESKLPKNFYDVAIGNPPFQQKGSGILSDPEYAKHAFALHDYFFAKSIDRVKPGGLVVYVTSRYTMDKLNDKARSYLAERADLVGAIRLPQTAFKQNAGTEVVTDVLFLRKKVKGETFEHAQQWMGVANAKAADGSDLTVSAKPGEPDQPALINEYFVAHPEMVLGQHANTGSMYRDKEYTVTPMAGDIEAHFAKAVENLPADIYQAGRGSSAEAAKVREIDFNPKAKKEGNFYVTDAGVLMQREGGVGVRMEELRAKDKELIKDFVPLRDALKQAHHDQLNNGDWESSLRSLQTAYDKFTKKHGAINQSVAKTVSVKTDELDEDGNPTGKTITDEEVRRSFPLLKKLDDDPDYTLVGALENVDGDTGEVSRGAFLERRVLGAKVESSIATPTDALMTTLNDLGHVDMGVIAQRLGMSQAEAIDVLGSAVYDDPEGGWTTADEYLSGNVKRKLELARAAAKNDRKLERNVTALEAHQPEPLTPSQISPRMGMNWIPGDVYSQFMREKVGIDDISVEWDPRTKSWHFDWESPETHEVTNMYGRREKVYKSLDAAEKAAAKMNAGRDTPRYKVQAIETPLNKASIEDWGIPSFSAQKLMEHAITGAPVKVFTKKDADSKPTLDEALTEAANEKLKKLHAEFEAWVFSEPNRSDRLVQLYNDKFNTTTARSFDGSHLTLPGASLRWQEQVHAHVKRGVWRIVQTGNTYLAHAVGSGKTAQMVMSAMEQKRLGLIKKPMIVVPNHMLKQFASEWLDIYPAARLMVADEHNFHTDNRRRFVSRVALSDLDGVVITHSAFKLLDLDPEFKAKMIEEQLTFFRAALEEAGGDPDGEKGKSRDPKVKRIEKQIENMEQKLEAAMSSEGKDKNARFDELGVDFLYVDEAHEFRKLDFTTVREVKGLSPMGSGKAFDLYMKSRYLESKTPGRSMVMASGTPVTNTMAELYSVQKMLGHQALVDKGLEDFDSWASMFGREKTNLEPDASGKYENVSRFQEFVNVPEMTQMFREFADVLTADYLAEKLGDKRPKVQGGARTNTITPKTAEYQHFQGELRRRMEASREWKPSFSEPNNPDPIIRIIGDGRLAAIDMRFMDPSLPSNPDSKLNRMIDDVIAAYKDTAGYEFAGKDGKAEPTKGAAMMVFSDLGFGAGVAASRGFNARAWMEKRLRDAGVAPAHVAFMQDYKKSSAKLKLFSDVNAGRVRILVGSSKSMGTGVNAQQRLKDLFHLDSPWYPADLEQREGRIVRQGNKNKEVRIKAYAAKGTYDEQMWGQLANKQLFIDKAMSGDPNVRSIEDAGSADNMAIMAGMVADDPRVLQLAGLETEIGKLQRLLQAHEDTRASYRQRYQNAQTTIDWNEARLPVAEKEAGNAKDLSGDKFSAKVGSQSFAERAKWAESLIAKYKDLSDRGVTQVQKVGEISGFDIAYGGETIAGQYRTKLMLATPNPMELVTDAGSSPVGVAMRAQNAVSDVARLPATMRERIREARATMDGLAARLETPFPMRELLAQKITERNALRDEMTKKDDKDGADDIAQGDTSLSRGGHAGMDYLALQTLVSNIQAKMPNMPKVHVYASPADLPPSAKGLRDYITEQGAWNDVEGAMHNGELYMFASGLSGALRAEHVLVEHEAAHYGLRAILGDALPNVMQAIYNNNASVRRAVTAMQRRARLSDIAATEEVIVDIPSAELARLDGWRKVVMRVRDFLLDHGFEAIGTKLTQFLNGTLNYQQRADLMVADLVRSARGFVSGNARTSHSGVRNAVALSQSLSDDFTKQEKWLSVEARARGYKDIDTLAEQNYPLFEKLAELWRKKNPADNGVLLSRRFMALVSAQSELDAAIKEAGKGLQKAMDDKKGTQRVMLGRSPHVLSMLAGRAVGMPTNPLMMVVEPGILNKTVAEPGTQASKDAGKHFGDLDGVSGEDLARAIYRPAAVVNDPSQAGNYNIVTNILTTNGPLVVNVNVNGFVMVDGKQQPAVFVNSIYARELGEVGLWLNGKEYNEKRQIVDSSRSFFYIDQTQVGEAVTGRLNPENKNPAFAGRDLSEYKGAVNTSVAVARTAISPISSNSSIVSKYGSPANENYRGLATVDAGLQRWVTGKGLKPGLKPAKTYGNLLAWIDKQYKGDAADKPMFSRAPVQKTAQERADTIISTKAASRAPLDYMAQGLTRVTGVEKVMGKVYDRAATLLDRYTPEVVKAGLVSDYGVPQAVMDHRSIMQGNQRQQLRKAGSLLEKLSTLTRAESRVAYEWMNMDGSDPRAYLSMMQGLPEESVKVLTEVQKLIDEMSQEAMRLGQLSPEAYKANRFAYLRRSYVKHTAELTKGEAGKRAKAIAILGDQYKGRGMTDGAAMKAIQNIAPEWWKRKLQAGKADSSLKGEKFLRLERRAPSGEGVKPLDGMEGKAPGKLLEVHYYPAGEALPAKYKDWSQSGTWEVRDVKGGNLVMWRDFTKDERERMGEIDEARYAIAKTLHAMIHDVEVGRYLEWLGQTYGKLEGEAIPGVVVEASEHYRDAFKPEEWVKVPESKISGTSVTKYGKLAGQYIPGPIWNDLRQVVNGQFKPLGDTYAEILRVWKTSKTALSPAVHTNNIMSNFVMADWHDVTAGHMAKALRIIMAASKGTDRAGLGGAALRTGSKIGIADADAAREVLNRYRDSGGDIGGWVTNEIRDEQLKPLLDALEKELAATAGASVQAQVGVFSALQHALMLRFPSAWEALKAGKKSGKAVSAVTTEAANLIDLYQSEDDVFRLAAWLKAKEDGRADLDAGKLARNSFLDYRINAPWVQAMRHTAWPFVSFSYRAVPMFLETAGKKPHKLMKLMMLAGAVNALGVMLAGGDDDKERKLLPEEKAGKIWGMVPKLVRMPWNDGHGSPVYLDIRRFIPVGDVFDVGAGHSAVPLLPSLTPGGPMVLMAEVVLNRSAFTGKSITLETDTTGQQAAKVVDHLYKAFAPNLLGLPGTYATTGVVDSIHGRTDPFGREMSTPQALASSFGIKLGSYPADVLRRNQHGAAQAKLMEIDRNISQLKRQRQTNRIDDAEFRKAVQVENEKKAKLMQELAKKM